MPVLVAIHGGGGTKEGSIRATCKQLTPGPRPPDTSGQSCITAIAEREGFIIVSPSGTPNARGQRGFNAGGGVNGYACMNNDSCSRAIDDVGYFQQVLDDLQTVIHVDPARIFVTGISNGGAMSHRLACELSSRIAAMASVAGEAQLAVSDPARCVPSRPVPVMVIHGTDDPGWPYEAPPPAPPGQPAMLTWGDLDGLGVSAQQSVDFWKAHNGCTTLSLTSLPDLDPDDGSTVTRMDFGGCRASADVVLLRVEGGGHTWPGGWQYASTFMIGTTNRDISASELIWSFFAEHPMP